MRDLGPTLAVERFWEHGYEATSIRDLAEIMGMTGASIYNAFETSDPLSSRVGSIRQTKLRRSGWLIEGKLPPREAIGASSENHHASLDDRNGKAACW